MIGASRIALAVGGGYLLGRTRKLKFAIVVGGAVTGRRLPTSPTQLLRMGAKVVAASPEFTRLSEAVRGRLLVAGRDAAIAAAGYQMELLTDRLTARLELLETPARPPRDVDVHVDADVVEPTADAPELAALGAAASRFAVAPITVSVPDDRAPDRAPDDAIEADDAPSRAATNGHVIEGAPA